jgi:hypothetical protein
MQSKENPRTTYITNVQYESYSQGFKHGYYTGVALTCILTIAFQKIYEKYRL